MYRGRPPTRDEYPPYEGRGPRPHFREERDRPRPPFQPYHDGPPDPYRRSPPRRRYPSPGSGSHRGPGGEYWGSGPTRPRSQSPCSGIPVDHSLVITVGNEFTGLPSRDYPPYPPKRSSYDSPDDRGPRRQSPSRGRSRPRSRSPEYRRQSKSRPRSRSPAMGGRSKSRIRSRSPEMGGRSRSLIRSRSPEMRGRSKSRVRSPEMRGRSKSRARSRSPEMGGRSKSRARSRSPEMGGRSKSRARSRSPEMGGRSKSRARSRSPERGGRSKSRVRSRSPEMGGRSKSRARSRSPEMGGRSKSRARSRSPEMGGRSKSRARSRSPEMGKRSRSRPPSRSRSRSRGRGRSYSHKSRSRSVSTSSTSSSSSRSSSGGGATEGKEGGLKELELARRRKEMEDMLIMPTKSILKRRVDSDTDSPSYVQDSDSPRVLPASEAEAERLLSAMKGMDPNMLATMLGELRDDPHMAQGRLDSSGIAGILGLLGGAAAQQDDKRKKIPDIDDEEKFLYGDEDDLDRGKTSAEIPLQTSLSGLYSDISEPGHYGTALHLGSQSGSVEQTSSHQQQVDMRYQPQSRSSATPDQNIKVEELNDYPPGTGPLVGKEKQDVEEYEKIQDLLKTIGLDLGVTEISKMAARTQERLHGKRPAPKTPTRRPGKRRGRRDASGSSDRGRRKSHSRSSSSSGSSHSHSPSHSRSGSRDNIRNQMSPPPDRHSDHGKARGGRELNSDGNTWGRTVSPALEPSPVPPPHQSLSMPAYPHAQGHGLVPQNYPPPGYGQYGNWPYMTHQWPMYPPSSMGMPPQSPVEDFPNAPVFDRPFLKVIQPELTQGSDRKASLKAVSQDNAKDKRALEERNNESQKQKVLEEREKLKQDREIRMKKKDYLMKELERLRKQQGELLRKKRREKDGHKDPLLSEISRLQEEVMSQIGDLRKEHEVAEKKRSELDKVALILGLQPNDKPRQEVRASVDLEKPKHPQAPEKEKKQDRRAKSPVAQASAKIKSSSRASPEKPKETPASTKPPETPPDQFEYYDAGNHWCKSCNVTCGSMFDFFTHLHSKSHRKTLDPYSRPWASTSANNEKNKILSSAEKLTKPAKGSEFLVPVKGYYCQLCEEFCGDAICAEDHSISHTHNEKYKKRMYEHPLYEQRRNLDRQAGLTLEVSDKKQSELKRKHDEEESKKSKEKEEGKHKRSKKDKEEDRKAKHKEAEEKARQKEEEEKARLIEEERYKLKRDEIERRNKYSKEGGERPRYSKKEEEERYKYRREDEEKLRYRRDEEDRSRSSRVDERPKSSWRDNDDEDEDRSRYGKWKESSPKYNKKEERYRTEHEEGKFKNEKEDKQLRKEKSGLQREDKSESRKQFEPEKPIEPPKVFCGPNPALRAKLRKKSEETAKVEPKPQPAFGKFSWKKKLENELAKEAERVAAEFLKEDEAEPEEDEDPDAFSKSVAAAKSIAFKLSGKAVIPPTNTWAPFSVGKIRPNLPAPSMVLRKASGLGPWVYAKPAPLNTFLSIRPPGPSGVTPVIQNEPKNDPVLAPDIISKAFCGKEVELKSIPDSIGKPDPTSTQEEKANIIVKPVPTSTSDESKASTIVSVSQAPILSPKAVIPEFKTPLPPPPFLTMMAMKSDVSAPGVPESEQNVLVMVTPPPFVQKPPTEVITKLEKPKSRLAAAKAQDLFDIFYSSSATASTTSTICTTTATKALVESKPEQNVSKNSEALVSAVPQTQPKLTANDNSNTVETDTQESMEKESGSDLHPVIPIETVNNSEQTKSSQAAGHAQDLIGVGCSSSTTASTTSTICTTTATKALVESKPEQKVSKNSEALVSAVPQTQPKLTANDNSNTVETDTQESMEKESGSDLHPVIPIETVNNSEQTKSSQAAGHAQDLIGVGCSSSTTANTTSTICTTTATKALVESKPEQKVSKNSEALVSAVPQTQPKLTANDNSNTVETDTQESMEKESGSDLHPVIPIETVNNSEQTKSSQAAGHAQDLIGVGCSSSTTASTTSTICTTTATKALVESKPEQKVSKNSEALVSAVPQTQPKLTANDNSNTVETDTQESMEKESGSDLHPVIPIETVNNSEQTKSSQAAGHAQDLIGVGCSSSTANTTSTEAVIDSKSEHVSKNSKAMEDTLQQIQPTLTADENSNKVETDMQKSMETESVPDLQQVVPCKVVRKSKRLKNKKSSLAAGSSQDLFNLFYSSSTTTSSTCKKATKAVLESKSETNDTKNSEALQSMDQTPPSISAHENGNTVITNTLESREAESEPDLQPNVDIPKNVSLSVFDKHNPMEADIHQSTETEQPKEQPNEETPENVPVQLDNQLSAVETRKTIETDTEESKTEIQSDQLGKEETPKSTAVELDIPLSPVNKCGNIEPDIEELQTEIGSEPEPKEETLEDILENAPVQMDNPLLAVDSVNVETHTSESMENENRSDPQPKKETLEESPEDDPLQLDNPSDTLGISTETLDLPTEVLSLDLFDFNF
ncbi:hypothetical protein UPYG_G00322320 [Umbra pygmaea]|uniref:U1-type domain-containing protein n=1 Tax=Umbra pygmaea TaxID=75934 RepID=A0ABD0W0M8_UMBPY